MISRFPTIFSRGCSKRSLARNQFAPSASIFIVTRQFHAMDKLRELNRVLKKYPNIVGIFGFGDLDHSIKIPFAPALADTPERYGFNDFPFEFGAVRRAFLLVWDNPQNICPSFSLAIAMQAGIAPEQTDSGMRIGKALFPRFERNEGR